MKKEISRINEIEIFNNNYGSLFNDETLNNKKIKGKYLRWVWKNKGVVIVPESIKHRIAFIETYRYPIGKYSLELPRGGKNHGESILDAAKRELFEETGLQPNNLEYIKDIYTDTGFIENCTSIVRASIPFETPMVTGNKNEEMELIKKDIYWLTKKEIIQEIGNGRIFCGITIASIFLII